ncbi:MAG: hypothetical protein U0R28_12435 [Candidatus Nanopelagicales bacterium]
MPSESFLGDTAADIRGNTPDDSSAPAFFDCHEFGHWAVELVLGDVVVHDPDLGEDGLIELAADFVAGVPVEPFGVTE